MAQPAWLSGSRKSWERIGFLKLAALFSSWPSSPSDFVENMKRAINSSSNIPYNPEFVDWLATNGLLKRNESKKIIVEQQYINTNVQYWWIFNTVPCTGWLSREAIPEYFESLPRKMGILEQDFSPSELGRTLTLGLISDSEVTAWKGEVFIAESPLELTPGQRLFFLYNILKADGDFMLLLLHEWIEQFGCEKFTYLDAGRLIPQALSNMASYFRSSAYSNDDQRVIGKIDDTRIKIEQQIENMVEMQGSGSRREQTSIPRIGWLLDIGVLHKEDMRTYRFTERGLQLSKVLTCAYRDLLSRLYPEDCLTKLLNQALFGPSMVFICGDAKKADRKSCLNLLKEVYQILKGPLGYVLIRSLLLVANGRQAVMGKPEYFEYDDALEVVESEYRNDPGSVYYTVDRIGQEHQIKFAQ